MKRLLIIGGVLGGVAVAGRAIVRKCGGFDMAGFIESMPDTAPPKWMFTNISAIRENTDRILEILDTRVDE